MLSKIAKKYVLELFDQSQIKGLTYHNKMHTEIVTNEAIQACSTLNISEVDYEIIITAAWFHDIGYLYQYENHESRSIDICTKFLISNKVNIELIERINNCIVATELRKKPKTKIEGLLKDIDIAYALYTGFKKTGDLLRTEHNHILGKTYKNEQWDKMQNSFLDNILFHSEYGKAKYGPILNKLIKVQ